MKSSFGARRNKRVYYFDHQNGVLKNKAGLRFKVMGSLCSVMLLGGLGYAGNFALAHYQKPVANYQEQTAPADIQKKSGQPDDLKKESLQPKEDEALAKLIRKKVKDLPGGQQWSVYVRDLDSPRMANVESDKTYDAGSFGNLFLLPALESKLSADYWKNRVGKQTVTNCVTAMIGKSDQACAQALGQYSDWKKIDAVNKAYGFNKTTITKDRQQTTARETGELLFKLQNSQLLSDKARCVVFDALYGKKPLEGIAAACTETCLIAGASSASATAVHDSAIITDGNARYLIVVMSSGGKKEHVAEIAATVRLAMQP